MPPGGGEKTVSLFKKNEWLGKKGDCFGLSVQNKCGECDERVK